MEACIFTAFDQAKRVHQGGIFPFGDTRHSLGAGWTSLGIEKPSSSSKLYRIVIFHDQGAKMVIVKPSRRFLETMLSLLPSCAILKPSRNILSHLGANMSQHVANLANLEPS